MIIVHFTYLLKHIDMTSAERLDNIIQYTVYRYSDMEIYIISDIENF